MADRKPLVILGVLALVAIAAYLTGVLGPNRGGADGGWPGWASPKLAAGDALTTADLRGDASCDIGGTTITFVGGCVVQVRAVTGGLPWEKATRRAILTVGPQPVSLTVTLAGKTLHDDLDPGDDVRLTYTRDGGTFALACAAVGGCTVVLGRDG